MIEEQKITCTFKECFSSNACVGGLYRVSTKEGEADNLFSPDLRMYVGDTRLQVGDIFMVLTYSKQKEQSFSKIYHMNSKRLGYIWAQFETIEQIFLERIS